MAQCFKCKKNIGILKRTVKMGPQKLPYCVDCAKEQEKIDALEFLLRGTPPNEVFRIPLVTLSEPYDSELKTQLLGDLVFFDKGICFVQLVEFKIPSQHYALMFGLVGMLISQSKVKKAMKKAIEEFLQKKSEALSQSLEESLQKSPRVMVFPREDILEIKKTLAATLKIKTHEKKPIFTLERGKKTFREFEERIHRYMNR